MKKIDTLLTNFNFNRRCLIPVVVQTLNKGCLIPSSHICLPTEEDLNTRRKDVTFTGPIQTSHTDDNKQKRIKLRTDHTKLLKRLRRARIREKRLRLSKGLPLKITKRKCSPTEDLVKEYLKEIRELWIPSKITSLRQYCNREICGFVLESGFSFLKSHYVGLGYITCESLRSLLRLQINAGKKDCAIVLARSSDTLNYRFCSLNVVVS